MRKALLGVLPAALLSACMGSTRSMPPSSISRPSPPAEALAPCLPTPQRRQTDGSATAGDDESTIRDGRFDLRRCDDKRRLLIEAWPK
jgi:hypothetical protein